jgi:acetyl-CoA carboxylase carboxyl transferase subunit beta
MSWFKRQTEKIGELAPPEERTVRTEGLFVKCDNDDCGATLYRKDLVDRRCSVCPRCGYHFRIGSRERLQMLFDDGQFEELDAEVAPSDPLQIRRQLALRGTAEEGPEAVRGCSTRC